MSGRERVQKAIRFTRPDRIPLAKGPDADIGYVGFRTAVGFAPERPGADEWGCVRVSLRPGEGDQGQVLSHPLADWDRAAAYRFPDPHAAGRFEGAERAVSDQRAAGRFVLGSLGMGPMHGLDHLRGFEGYLEDLVLAPGRIVFLLDGILGFLAGLVEEFAGLGVDGVLLFDDQAMQTGPVFSMALWDEHFAPRYRALFALAHRRGMAVFLHSCGHLGQHLARLAAVGVDAIDNKQPGLWMDDPAVDAVRGRVAFSTCLDIQRTPSTIPEARIVPEVDRLVRRLGTPDGGFIGTFYHQQDLGIPAAQTAAMLRAFRELRW
jgi:uroporphyrinogen decarboxylase